MSLALARPSACGALRPSDERFDEWPPIVVTSTTSPVARSEPIQSFSRLCTLCKLARNGLHIIDTSIKSGVIRIKISRKKASKILFWCIKIGSGSYRTFNFLRHFKECFRTKVGCLFMLCFYMFYCLFVKIVLRTSTSLQVRTGRSTTKLQTFHFVIENESYLGSAFVFSLSSTVIQAHDARRRVIKFQTQVIMRESVQLFLVKMCLRLT